MKKQIFVFPILIFIAILIFSCSKDENNSAIDNETQSNETLNRSGSVNSVADIENWFEQYLTDNIGVENVAEGLLFFNVEWNNYIEWNENTFVFPMYHFVPYGRVGYTRLFVDISDVEPEAYFYSVFPDNQDQVNFDINDVIEFNGDLFTFDIINGYQDMLEYENGELVRYYHEDELIVTRGGGLNWPDWWKPREEDGGGNNDNWPWDDYWVDDGSADTGDGGTLDCFAPCPNGYPKSHPTRLGIWLKCHHERDCDGIIDIEIINIPSSGRKIHKIGSNTTKGNVGGTNGNNPPNGNPKNPIDIEGLDEARLQQFKNLVCQYKAYKNLECSCEQLVNEISFDCLDADNFFDCADANGEYCRTTIIIEDDECILAIDDFEAEHGITLTKKEKMAIHQAFAENGGSCSDEGFDDDTWNILCDRGFDYVTTIMGDCPKVHCMYEKLRLLEDNDVCKIIRKLEAEDYGIHLIDDDLAPYPGTEITPFSNTSLHTLGSTKKVIKMKFDNDKACKSDNPLQVAESLLHEFLHAEFYVELLKLGWDGDDGTFDTYWNQYLNNLAITDNITTHEVIAKYYLLPIATALWELNGNVGTPQDYYGYTLYGVYYEEDGVSVNPFMTDYGITSEQAVTAFNTSENVVGGDNMILEFDINCE